MTLMKTLQCLLKMIAGASGMEQQICQVMKYARKALYGQVTKLIQKSK